MNVKEFSIHVFHCSVIKVPVSFWQLWYSIISFCACQELMTIKNLFLIVLFFKVFLQCVEKPFSTACNFLLFVVVFATAILDYHIFSDLSTTFLTFSKIFGSFISNILKLSYQLFPYRSCSNLFILSQVLLFVNNFFHNFQNCVKSFEILWCFLSLIGDS